MRRVVNGIDVMLENTRLQAPLFPESTQGGSDENQRREHKDNDQHRDDILRTQSTGRNGPNGLLSLMIAVPEPFAVQL